MGVARQFLQNAAAIRFFRTQLLQVPQLPHVVLQQIPPTQFPEVHCAASVHVFPLP